jgi:hypothetical protein
VWSLSAGWYPSSRDARRSTTVACVDVPKPCGLSVASVTNEVHVSLASVDDVR